MSKLEQAFRQLVGLRQQLEDGGVSVNVRTFDFRMKEALDILADGIHEKAEAEETPVPAVLDVRADVWSRAAITYGNGTNAVSGRDFADVLLMFFDDRFPEYKKAVET
jgi:hypothetical protein